jgi:hypothetical protein
MQRTTCFLTVLLSLVFAPSEPPRVLTSATVRFPSNGDVSIEAAVKQGSYPRLIFRSRKNAQPLLEAEIGSGSDWKEPVTTRSQPDWVLEKLGFIVIHRPGLPDPTVVALAMYPGGSDCRYRAALLGEVGGQLRELTPSLPDHYTRGGDLLAKDAKGDWTLNVYSERYQVNDVHVNGPSRMAVFSYVYDRSLGKFVEAGHRESRDGGPSETDPNLVLLFGDFAQC